MPWWRPSRRAADSKPISGRERPKKPVNNAHDGVHASLAAGEFADFILLDKIPKGDHDFGTGNARREMTALARVIEPRGNVVVTPKSRRA